MNPLLLNYLTQQSLLLCFAAMTPLGCRARAHRVRRSGSRFAESAAGITVVFKSVPTTETALYTERGTITFPSADRGDRAWPA